jgi:thiamine pyrophosphate-dependent acetolactate synthase large subunit-like protein
MGKTAAAVMVDALVDWGVEVVFGLPGDGINGIMEALRQRQDDIRFVQVRHEEAAAFAAFGRRGVAHLTFPVDLQDLEVEEEEPSKMKVPGHTSAALTNAIVVPPPAALRRAAEVGSSWSSSATRSMA